MSAPEMHPSRYNVDGLPAVHLFMHGSPPEIVDIDRGPDAIAVRWTTTKSVPEAHSLLANGGAPVDEHWDKFNREDLGEIIIAEAHMGRHGDVAVTLPLSRGTENMTGLLAIMGATASGGIVERLGEVQVELETIIATANH